MESWNYTENRFLSTPSARRATFASTLFPDGVVFLSTPSARRATPRIEVKYADLAISIHALREEGDHVVSAVYIEPVLFLSTPSARRATRLGRRLLRR